MSTAAENNAKKVRGRPFRKGERANPSGRPIGARNRATIAAEALLHGEAESLTRRCIEMALGGDTTALKLALERILPPVRERPLSLAMPAMKTLADLPDAVGAIIAAVGASELTPSEASSIVGLLAAQRDAIEAASIESRLIAIEERLADGSHDAQH